jgi:prolyl 4-hydroxylase
MDGLCVFILLVVLIVIIFGVGIIYTNNQNKKKEHFEGNYQERGFSSEDQEYQKPVILENVIDQNKIQEIIDYAKDKLVDSKVLGGRNSNVRNSMQTWIPKNNPIVQPIYQKVSAIYGIPIENAEDLQVVRYQPGQYYNEHHDSCCAMSKECQDFEAKGGQRKLTVLIYLNEDFTDGETYFPKLNIKLKAAPGDAVVFHPLAENTQCHPHALHAGSPVTSGEKWIATIWFRERKLS